MSESPQPPEYAPPPAQSALVQQQLAAARLASKKLRRASGVAIADGWMIAIFAGLSFIFGLLAGDISSALIGAGMAVIAYIEFDGAARLRRLDPAAPRRLACNQLAFAGLLILYSLWSLHKLATGSAMSADLQPYEAQLGGDFNQLMRTIWYTVYGTLIAVAIFGQGGTALYYFTREKYLHQYVHETPPWIIEMQRAGSPL